MKNQYYRTFIAAPLRMGEPFMQARNNLMEALREERISWTNPEQYHVTLRFIGETEQTDMKRICHALQNDFPVPGQINMDANELGSFGPRKKPRVIWVGFEESSFIDLMKLEVDRMLEICGIPIENQPFRAHLTLGRVRSLKDLQLYYRIIQEMKHDFKATVLFDRLVYFRSILGSGGPQYQVLEEVKFPE